MTSLDAQQRDVNERRKVHDFMLASVLAVPFKVICGFLGLPVQDGIISEKWVSGNQN